MRPRRLRCAVAVVLLAKCSDKKPLDLEVVAASASAASVTKEEKEANSTRAVNETYMVMLCYVSMENGVTLPL